MRWYDPLRAELPLIPLDLSPAGPDESAAPAAPAPRSRAGGARGTLPAPVGRSPAAPGALPATIPGEAAFGLLDTPDAPPPEEESLIPAGTPIEEAIGMLSDHDRDLATEIERDLSAWERRARAAGPPPDEADIEQELLRLIGAKRSGFTAPDGIIAHYVMNLRGGLFGIENYLARPLVSDVLLNDWDRVFIEERGHLEERRSPLRGPQDLQGLVDRIVTRTGGALDLSHPVLDDQFAFTMPGGGDINVRVNICLGSLTVTRRPVVSLRKPVASGYDDLATWARVPEKDTDSAITPAAERFLRLAAANRASMLIVGGTGSGKTSLMKALLGTIERSERVVVVEEANELDLRTLIDDCVGLRANDAPNQGISALIRSAMRMRPDRVIVGELREGSEVDGFLRAINTGHAGSISTIHASSAKDGLQALLTLAAQNAANKSSTEHIGRLIHPGLDLVVFLAAQYLPLPDGRKRRVRRVMEIATITEFRVVDGVPDFIISHVFDRSAAGPGIAPLRNIESPLRSRGFAGLSDAFVARMHAQGVSEDTLRAVLESRR